jgi:RNA methyltransferase, TrmH family
MHITSLENPHIKGVVRLKDRAARDETGLTVIDGLREVSRAFEAGATFKEIYLCRELFEKYGKKSFLAKIEAKEIPIFEVTKEIFHKIAFGDRREGIVGICQPALKTLMEIPIKEGSLFVVVEDVEKPGNLGAILRSCDGAGVDALIVSDPRTDIYNPNVIRASVASVFSVPVVQAINEEVFPFLRERGVRIVATSPDGEKIYANANLKGSVAIVVGSEQKGLSSFWMTHADVKVRIPMHGKSDSLNVSITTAIIVYEAVRQRETARKAEPVLPEPAETEPISQEPTVEESETESGE